MWPVRDGTLLGFVVVVNADTDDCCSMERGSNSSDITPNIHNDF